MTYIKTTKIPTSIFPSMPINTYTMMQPSMNNSIAAKSTLVDAFKPKRAGTKTSHIVFVLDDSASMQSCKEATISGYNEYLKMQKKDAEENKITTFVSLYKFDGDNVNCVFNHVDVNQVEELNEKTYNPRGMTNLHDAIGGVMIQVNTQLKAHKKEDRDSIIITILTDGQENSSRTFNDATIKQMVEKAEGKNWGFMFLGANIDAFAAGSNIGFNVNNTIQYDTASMTNTILAASSMTTRMKGLYATGADTSVAYASAGFTAAETQRIFGTMTKAAGVLGLKTDELTGIYLALEQMISKGKITTEELRRQLGERLPGAMDIMAKSMGVTTSELDKMMKKGEVLTKDVLPAFARQVEIAYGIESVTKVETLTAATTNLGNAWTELIAKLEGSEGGISSPLISVLNFITSIVEQHSKWQTVLDSNLNSLVKTMVVLKGLNPFQQDLFDKTVEALQYEERRNELRKEAIRLAKEYAEKTGEDIDLISMRNRLWGQSNDGLSRFIDGMKAIAKTSNGLDDVFNGLEQTVIATEFLKGMGEKIEPVIKIAKQYGLPILAVITILYGGKKIHDMITNDDMDDAVAEDNVLEQALVELKKLAGI